jgi:FkbH-like protein
MVVMSTQGGARILREKRLEIASALAALVSNWPKYAGGYAADPQGFAEVETAALIDYIASLLDTGDETWLHLYIGEKAKQFHDPSEAADMRVARERALLASERLIFADALAGEADCVQAVDGYFDRIEAALLTEAAATVKALFIGDCLYLDVVAFLTGPALEDGIRISPTFVTSHDPAAIKAQLGKLADTRFDIVFLSPFNYALLSDYEALQRPRLALDPAAARRHAAAAVASAEEVFDTAADLFDCPIVVHAPAPVWRHSGTGKEWLKARLTLGMRKRATDALCASLAARAAERQQRGQMIHLLDEAALLGGTGLWEAGRYIYRTALQHPARFGTLIAARYRDLLFVVARLLKRKLVVCDLDNTLWEGVIGEGLGVRHHYDRQAPLLVLKERGVVLAINSKNDPAKAVWEAEDGRLSVDHFVSRQINWDPKPLNMKRIADHLNLKEKDFVFIDDRADERAMVDEMYPTMATLDALDARSWRLLALWSQLLPAKADADRTDFYRQRDARQAFIASEEESSAAERGKLFDQLGLKLTIREAGAGDVARVTELINRTNQFNMAGSRIAKRRVEDLVASEDARVLIADAADRFGTMGTISVLIAERGRDAVEIPVFVLSCRVFGYGMEMALLETVRDLAGGGQALFGHFIETDHNQPCHDVYPEAGFERVDGGWRRNGAAASPIAVPDWLAIEMPAAIAPFSLPDAVRRSA